MYRPVFVFLLSLLANTTVPQDALAQRGGEVTVTITPGPEIRAELPFYTASGEHRLHFNNTTSRHAKILSIELLFIDQPDRQTNCDSFFGNIIGAASRAYDLKDLEVPSAKSVTAAAKLLPAAAESHHRVEPRSGDERGPRITFIACYKFVYEIDDATLEVYQPAGRWTFERKSGKLLQKNVAPKAELLPR